MSQQTRDTVKGYFETDDVPTQAQYADLIDSVDWHDDNVSADRVQDGSTNKAYTAAEKTKLAGIAANATAVVVDDAVADGNGNAVTSNAVYDALQTKADKDNPAFTTGITTPAVKITGGTPGAGKVLVSDADGDGSWQDAPASTFEGDLDDIAEGTTNKHFTDTEKTKLAGIEDGATANSTDEELRDRSTHTGTQSADSITDGTTNKAYTATEKTKLSGIATGATANDSDENLKDRANHTGEQAISTVTDLQTALDAKQDAWTYVKLPADVDNDNAVADTLEDVTGLEMWAEANKRYEVEVHGYFKPDSSNTTANGSRWAVNGPALTHIGGIIWQSNSTSGLTTRIINNAYEVGTLSATSISDNNTCIMQFDIQCSVAGPVKIRFSSELAGGGYIRAYGNKSYLKYRLMPADLWL
jgi:hypothetical protein